MVDIAVVMCGSASAALDYGSRHDRVEIINGDLD